MQITGEIVTLFVVLLGAASGIWWRIEGLVAKARDETQAVREELAQFKLDAARQYASVEHMRDVEVRLVTSIDRLADRLETMPDRLLRMMREAARP